MIRLFKIELCSENSFGVVVLAYEHVNIDHISDYRTNSYLLPILGPSYIDLYTEPQNSQRNYDCLKNDSFNNFNDESNGSFKARLYLSVTSIESNSLKTEASNKKNLLIESDKKLANKLEKNLNKKFKAFVMISDAKMILDSAFGSDLHFQLCVGNKSRYWHKYISLK